MADLTSAHTPPNTQQALDPSLLGVSPRLISGLQDGSVQQASGTGMVVLSDNHLGDTVVSPVVDYALSGIVQELGVPVARTVRAYRRDNGALLGEAVSSAADGSYHIPISGYNGQVLVMALDDAAGTDFNAAILDRVVPV